MAGDSPITLYTLGWRRESPCCVSQTPAVPPLSFSLFSPYISIFSFHSLHKAFGQQQKKDAVARLPSSTVQSVSFGLVSVGGGFWL